MMNSIDMATVMIFTDNDYLITMNNGNNTTNSNRKNNNKFL